MDFPIKYFERQLIFNSTKNECWAMYKLIGFNYDYKSDESKISILNAIARFLANIGIEGKILIVPISQNIDKHYKTLLEQIDRADVMYKYAKAHAEGNKEYLQARIRESGDANDYRVYVQTKLRITDNLLHEIKNAFEYMIKDPVHWFEELMGVEYFDVMEKELKAFQSLADEYMKKQSSRLALVECNEYDIQWLTRRPLYRGLGAVKLRGDDNNLWTPYHEKVIKHGEIAVRSFQRDVLTLAEGMVDSSDERTIMVHHGDKTSYQAFLPVTHIPDGLIFPGNEWLFVLQDYPIQTEVCIHITTTEYKESIRNVSKKKREIDAQIKHIQDSSEELPDELLDSKDYANKLESELKATRAPILNASITFCVYADNKAELEDNVNFIKGLYEDSNFIIERPASEQIKLFMEFFPGTGRYVTDYIQPLPPRTLAGGIIGATRLLGDNTGPYIGYTGTLKKMVFLSLARACLLNRSASAACIGTLGGGKSFGANLLFYLSVLYGGLGLVLDPKGERSNWLHDLPEFEGQINIITLSSSQEDKGKLDPWLIYKDDPDEAGYLALSILAEIFKLHPSDREYLAISEAIDKVKKADNRCMVLLGKELESFDPGDILYDDAIMAARRIKQMRNMAMAGLLFGDGSEEALSFKKKINVLQIQNLTMPSPDKPKEEYTPEEILSTVLMLPIASFARKFMHMFRGIFKIVLFDEAWALSSTVQGNQMMNALIREGRALFAGCLFIGHSTKDMRGEGIKTNVSYKFCFRANDNDEIRRMLDFLDLEATEENMEVIKNLKNGECLFKDLDGRVGKLKFDAVYEHLEKKAFNTTPQKKAGGEIEKTA